LLSIILRRGKYRTWFVKFEIVSFLYAAVSVDTENDFVRTRTILR